MSNEEWLRENIKPITQDDLLRLAARVTIPAYPTPACAVCGEAIYFTVAEMWRHVETDREHEPEPREVEA